MVEPAQAPVVEPVGDLVAEVVALVAEQTGYPADLLDLDLDLEADLGIDTVKQAELFAQVRERYGIERDDSLKLRDYPTLNHVIGFVRDRTPHQARRPAPVVEPAQAPVVEPVGDLVAEVVALVAEQTGLSGRPVGSRAGSGGGSGDRHGEASRAVRPGP